jgi:hypothetical protein
MTAGATLVVVAGLRIAWSAWRGRKPDGDEERLRQLAETYQRRNPEYRRRVERFYYAPVVPVALVVGFDRWDAQMASLASAWLVGVALVLWLAGLVVSAILRDRRRDQADELVVPPPTNPAEWRRRAEVSHRRSVERRVAANCKANRQRGDA